MRSKDLKFSFMPICYFFPPLSKAVLLEEMLCIFSACPAFASAIVCVQLELSSFTAVSGGDCSKGLGLGICA